MTLSMAKEIDTPEIVFISGITEREVYRLREERLLPRRRRRVHTHAYRLDIWDSVLANFYFGLKDLLSKEARLAAMNEFVQQIEDDFTSVSVEDVTSRHLTFVVHVGQFKDITIDFGQRVAEVASRAAELERVNALVSSDDEFDREPVFKDTRVPVSTVAAFLAKGVSKEDVLARFPTLTPEMVAAAPVWLRTHPQKGRPRKFGEINPEWSLKTSESVKFVRP